MEDIQHRPPRCSQSGQNQVHHRQMNILIEGSPRLCGYPEERPRLSQEGWSRKASWRKKKAYLKQALPEQRREGGKHTCNSNGNSSERLHFAFLIKRKRIFIVSWSWSPSPLFLSKETAGQRREVLRLRSHSKLVGVGEGGSEALPSARPAPLCPTSCDGSCALSQPGIPLQKVERGLRREQRDHATPHLLDALPGAPLREGNSRGPTSPPRRPRRTSAS